MEEVTTLITKMRSASSAERRAIRAELLALAKGPRGPEAREEMERAAKGERLEVQWEIEEVLEEVTPPKPKPAPEPPKAEPEPPKDPNRLTQADLVLVYDDPRGLLLHKTKVGNRWFATQVDPRTGQPQTFELRAEEIGQIKAQLAGSPYWVVGSEAV